MSDLSFLEKLLDGADVEWKALNDVTLPTSNIRWAETDQSYRYIDLTSVDRETGEVSEADEITAKTAPSRAQKLVEANDLIFATTRPAQQRLCLISPEWSGAVASTGYCVLRPDRSQVEPGWLLHWISSSQFKAYVEEHQTGSAYPAISDGKVKAFKIPVPYPENAAKSLAIQGEIVRVLDGYTKLTAKLSAELAGELEARKKQYNYYRDQLITVGNGEVEWLTMDDIGEFIRGKRFTKADYRDDGIRAIHYGEIYTHYGVFAYETLSKVRADMANCLRFAEKNDVIMAGVSETLEDVGKAVAWLGEDRVAIHDDSYAFRHAMNPKYIAYAMQSDAFHDQKGQFVSRGKIKRLLIDGMKKVKLPIPFPDTPQKSLAEQARIVAILDKFDKFTSSIGESLPREIALRKKQYEYYRDLVFSFAQAADV